MTASAAMAVFVFCQIWVLHLFNVVGEKEVQGADDGQRCTDDGGPLTCRVLVTACACAYVASRTYTGHGLILVYDLWTEEIPLADDENGETRASKHRCGGNAQKEADLVVHSRHAPFCRTIGAGDDLIIASDTSPTTQKPLLPIDLQDLVHHGHHPHDGVNTACGHQQGSSAEAETVRCRDDEDVGSCATAHWRVWSVGGRASQTATWRVGVGELAGIVRYRNASGFVKCTVMGFGSVKLNRQAKHSW
jgi:hypothetical protein